MTFLIKENGRRFYGNASVIVTGNIISLCSYNTIVCQIVDGEFRRTWHGWSASTARHVRIFLKQFAPSVFREICQKAREGRIAQKAVWQDMPCSDVIGLF